MKRTLVVCAFLLGLVPMARSQAVAVSADLSLEHNELLPDEKMYLKLTVVNRSGQDLKLGCSSTFSVDEIKDLSGIINRLRQHTDGLSDFLWKKLSGPNQQILTEYQPSEPSSKQAQVVVLALNTIIKGPGIFESERFTGVSLRPETADLMRQNPTGSDLAFLNRLLLEDGYPLELLRNQAGGVRDWLTFTVLGEKSALVQQLRDDHDYCEGVTNVPTGSSASREFNLTPYFDFRKPGNYTVKAAIKIPQWQQVISVPPVAFSIVNGIRLQNIPYTDQPVGVPFLQVGSNQPPEVRKFYLERSDVKGNMNLFVRLTDGTGTHTMRLVPIGPYFSFAQPDVRLDRFNNLHVLHQVGAQKFSYCVIDTLGQILERQTYNYTDQRPVLRSDDKGEVIVTGGARVVSATDLPPP